MGSVLAAEVFTTAHIAVTAAISGGLARIDTVRNRGYSSNG
jgi:hypothetical protein